MAQKAALIGGFVATALAVGTASFGLYFIGGDRNELGLALFGMSLLLVVLAVTLFRGKRWGRFTFFLAWALGPLALVPWFGWWALIGLFVPLIEPDVTFAILELLKPNQNTP